MERRIKALEDRARVLGCKTCRDWKKIEVVHVDNPAVKIPASHCPDCGREARKVISITQLEYGPQ